MEKPQLKFIIEDLLGCHMKLMPKCHLEIAELRPLPVRGGGL
jgi:hypothetical protein